MYFIGILLVQKFDERPLGFIDSEDAVAAAGAMIDKIGICTMKQER